MQIIADRTVLLGEARADLMTVTEAASSDLKRLAAFDVNKKNKYYQIADYYAVINNCNYYLAHVDTAMQRRGRQLFRNEFAAVKSFRAWTYLELVKAYGEVPLVTTPLMTEREAAAAVNGPKTGIKEICEYFINDLTPYAYVNPPVYGSIGERSSAKFFIPTRVLLGDLCLWAGRYDEAAKWYSSYLNDRISPVRITPDNRVRWTTPTIYTSPSGRFTVNGSEEQLGIVGIKFAQLVEVGNSFSSSAFLHVGVDFLNDEAGVTGVFLKTCVNHGHGLLGIAQTVVASGKVLVNIHTVGTIGLHLIEIGQSRVVVLGSQGRSGGEVQHLIGI